MSLVIVVKNLLFEFCKIVLNLHLFIFKHFETIRVYSERIEVVGFIRDPVDQPKNLTHKNIIFCLRTLIKYNR